MQNVTVTVFEKLSLFSSTAFKSAKGDSFLSLPFISFPFISFIPEERFKYTAESLMVGQYL